MKKNYLLILGLILMFGCREKEEVVVRIGDFKLTKTEFEEELKEADLIESPLKAKEEFLENLINQKLILLEAERMGLDKKREFLKEVENFYEKTLLKRILDKKSKELATRVKVEEDEIMMRYKEMINKDMTNRSYEDIYEEIRWQILKEKQNQEFSNWLEDLRKRANIKVNKELFGVRKETR